MRVQVAILAVALAAQLSGAAVYDRAITIFSPDGKLMQVSYAEEAVQRGSLAVAASNGRDAVVMCVECPSEDDAGPDDEDTNTSEAATGRQDEKHSAATVAGGEAGHSDKRGVDGKDKRRRRRKPDGGMRGMGTGVGVVDDANNQDRKLCEVDEGVYLAFAGISADGRVLASKIRLECQSYRYTMGTAPSVGYMARYVGGLQHRYTRTGGARPFGVSCLVAGFDEDTHPSIFRSEPSGAFAEWTASAVGKASEKALEKLESVPDFGTLDWRGTAEAAVRAALAGGAAECDVLVLRRKTAEAAATAGNAMAGAAGVGRGWRSRGGAWTKRFLGSVGRDGTVVLEAVAGPEVEGGEINEGSSLVL